MGGALTLLKTPTTNPKRAVLCLLWSKETVVGWRIVDCSCHCYWFLKFSFMGKFNVTEWFRPLPIIMLGALPSSP
jgi:hypothetical protein